MRNPLNISHAPRSLKADGFDSYPSRRTAASLVLNLRHTIATTLFDNLSFLIITYVPTLSKLLFCAKNNIHKTKISKVDAYIILKSFYDALPVKRVILTPTGTGVKMEHGKQQ